MRGELTINKTEDAIRAQNIIANILYARKLDEAATIQLQSWSYIISTQWQRMPYHLTHEECHRTFSDFRSLITTNNVTPWTADTPHHHRYILTLILTKKDEEVLTFMRTKESIEGFLDQEKLKECLELVIEHTPKDTGALLELGRIAKSEGKLGKALSMFETITKQTPFHHEAQLLATQILIQLGQNKQARNRLDTIMNNLTKDLDLSQQINWTMNLKEQLVREENALELDAAQGKLNIVRDELNAARSELNAVYSSTSWRATKPLRKIMISIRRHTS